MKHRNRSIEVKKLPERIEGPRLADLYRDMETCINVDGPAVVLDCSLLRQVDKPAIHFLLCCLEEAMKRNGDLRLAALTQHPMAEIASKGLNSLFQIFESVDEAVESFRIPRMHFCIPSQSAANNQRATENAA
jgi:anti-anti-sigma regulatory factor